MPETDERLAELCEQVWVQLRDIDPAEILAVLLAVTAEVIAANDTPEGCLAACCEMLGTFVHRITKAAEKPRFSHLRRIPKEPA